MVGLCCAEEFTKGQPNTVQCIPYMNNWRVKVTLTFTTINSACHFSPPKQEKQEKQEKPMKKQEKVFELL